MSESYTLCKEAPHSVMVVIVLVTALEDYINRDDRMGGDVVILLFMFVIPDWYLLHSLEVMKTGLL